VNVSTRSDADLLGSFSFFRAEADAPPHLPFLERPAFMSRDDDQGLPLPESAQMITFFAPDRPVENGTVFVLSEPQAVTVCDDDAEQVSPA
jgi:hypothetical protein